METKILWADLRYIQDQASPYRYLSEDWSVSRINGIEGLDSEIRETAPTLLCFEYDFPDLCALSALLRARSSYPSIPIIMLTEQHSETLAVWALRVRVWDYFVKPFRRSELVASVAAILEKKASSNDELAQHPPTYSAIPPEVRFRRGRKKRTDPAISYVERHFHEKIYESVVAQLCHMNASNFSRRFKKEHLVTFRDYVINYRIGQAQKLLLHPDVSITDVGHTVGFQDPSYFARTFRRVVGMRPSHYRNAIRVRLMESVKRGCREDTDVAT